MQLWTYHPSSFPLDSPNLEVDYTLGRMWKLKRPGFRYREVLPRFCERIGAKQFVWCKFDRGWQKFHPDTIEWELNVPVDAVRFYRSRQWEDLVWGRTDDWSNLIVEDYTRVERSKIEPIVFVPLKPGWATNHGQLPGKYARSARL